MRTFVLAVFGGIILTIIFCTFSGATLSETHSSSRMTKSTPLITSVARPTKERQLEPIRVHSNSSMRQDVKAIWHDSENRTVTVLLKDDARCPNPYLRARLSGPALVMLEWSAVNKFDTTNALTGIYDAPINGSYFLEMMTIYCDNFLHYNDTIQNDYDFSETCTEPALERLLTDFDTIIHVTRAKASTTTSRAVWLRKNGNERPLYTRFQPHGCYKNPEPRCNISEIASVERHNDYRLEFEQPLTTNMFEHVNTTVCLVGSSHARKMHAYLSANLEPGLVIRYIEARMPHLVTKSFIKRVLPQCQHVVISVGQWPAAKRFRINAHGPIKFHDFYQQYKYMLELIHYFFPNLPVYARSINYNPLGALIGDCKPQDWRTPLVIDGYNQVIQKATEEFDSVSFLDTDFIVGPMWDSASDWCHLDEFIGLPHALYVLAIVLGIWDSLRLMEERNHVELDAILKAIQPCLLSIDLKRL